MTTTEPLLLRSEVKKEEDLCLPIDVDDSPADSSLYSPTTTGGLQLEVIYPSYVISELKTENGHVANESPDDAGSAAACNVELFFGCGVVNWPNPLISGNRRQQQQNSAAASYF